MSEMIDRVAKALFEHDQEMARRQFPVLEKELGWGGSKFKWHEIWRAKARAAIEAMRTPTEAMIDAACCCERGDTVGDALRDEYQAMIDAAIHIRQR